MSGNLFEQPGSAGAASSSEWCTAHCDGGSRGNPGPAGYGAVIEDSHGQVAARLNEFLGIQTNNYAEYSGLLAVLKWALEHNCKRLRVISDSELMVKQMKGVYKVASPGLRPLWEEAKRLARQLERFEMAHTLRGGNKEADRLANEAMDRGMGKASGEVSRVSGASGVSGGSGVRSGNVRFGASSVSGRPQPAPAAKPARQVLEGYVKNGVVHLLEGELPEGAFVKVVKE